MNKDQITVNIKNDLYDSIEDFYERYRGEFVRWMYKTYKCSEEEAIEIYQVAILIVYENILSGKLKELKSSIKTYLFAIGKNKYMEHSRYKSKFIYEWDFSLEETVSERTSEKEINKEQDINQVMSSFEEIGTKCKEILQHFYYLNKTMEEIAAALHYKNADTVKNLKYKCLNRLRKLYKEKSAL